MVDVTIGWIFWICFVSGNLHDSCRGLRGGQFFHFSILSIWMQLQVRRTRFISKSKCEHANSVLPFLFLGCGGGGDDAGECIVQRPIFRKMVLPAGSSLQEK